MQQIAREVFLYAVASAVALAVDVALLVGLVERVGIPYLPAAICSFIAGGLVAYALCVRFIFRHHRLEDRRVEATSFIVLGLAGLAVSALCIAAGVEYLGLNYLVAKFGAAGMSFVVNYVLRRLLLFSPPAVRQQEIP